MQFPDALTMVLSGCKATRTTWDTDRRYIRYDAKRLRIRYVHETQDGAVNGRMDWNYYPVQADMLGQDWELIR